MEKDNLEQQMKKNENNEKKDPDGLSYDQLDELESCVSRMKDENEDQSKTNALNYCRHLDPAALKEALQSDAATQSYNDVLGMIVKLRKGEKLPVKADS